MQRYCTELTERLLKSLDKEYNVVDMGAVVDVITALEKTTITKEVLEITRLGKYINELRRKTNNDALAKRAKDLVRRWRDMVLPSAHTTPQPTPADTAPQALNGTKPQSPALRGLKPQSPALRGLKPQSPAIRNLKPQSPALKSVKPHSPLLRDTTPLKVLSPALSLHSDQSRSPNITPTKQQQQQQPPLAYNAQTSATTNSTNNRLNADVSSKIALNSTHNHSIEAVPRTHSSNKRLRKDETTATGATTITITTTTTATTATTTTTTTTAIATTTPTNSPESPGSSRDTSTSRYEPHTKRQRLNGETSSHGNTSQHLEINAIATIGTNNNNNNSNNNNNNNINVTVDRGIPIGATSLAHNQQVPSPRDTNPKTNERLSEFACHESSRDKNESSDMAVIAGPKKRGRKKGSKSVKNQNLPEDRVKEKLASISRNPKLKTTQELLADLQARGSTTGAFGASATTAGIPTRGSEPPSNEEILRNAINDDRPLSSRYARAHRDKTSTVRESATAGSPTTRQDSARNRPRSGNAGKRWETTKDTVENENPQDAIDSRTRELTVEEILAKLPPLDRDAICWSEDEDVGINDETRNYTRNPTITDDNDEYVHADGETISGDDRIVTATLRKREIRDDEVDRLHGECIEGVNGNFQISSRDPPVPATSDASAIANTNSNLNKERTNRWSGEITTTNNDRQDHHDNHDDSWPKNELIKRGIKRLNAGNEKDREFREWHEMLARPSYDGQTLHILPYVIID